MTMATSSTKTKNMSKPVSTDLTIERKYELYESAVQNPEFDIEFFQKQYKKKYKKLPTTLREDFCGTGFLSCEWVKSNPKFKAIGIDLDTVPIDYGKKHHYDKLSSSEKKRMEYIVGDVLKANKPSDIVAAMNFSYFIFKKRNDLLKYFKSVYKSMGKQGLFFLDIFGGLDCMSPIEDEVEHDDFTYYWDLDKYNPLTAECLYKIHFKEKGKKRRHRDVFVYDWRMWTVPELVELLQEAGFKDVQVFWEEDDDDGGGNGEFFTTWEAENCESWVSYIMASV